MLRSFDIINIYSREFKYRIIWTISYFHSCNRSISVSYLCSTFHCTSFFYTSVIKNNRYWTWNSASIIYCEDFISMSIDTKSLSNSKFTYFSICILIRNMSKFIICTYFYSSIFCACSSYIYFSEIISNNWLYRTYYFITTNCSKIIHCYCVLTSFTMKCYVFIVWKHNI